MINEETSTVHLIALLKLFIVRIRLTASKPHNVVMQIPAFIFIHHREQQKKLVLSFVSVL